jgi:hypothetical protein
MLCCAAQMLCCADHCWALLLTKKASEFVPADLVIQQATIAWEAGRPLLVIHRPAASKPCCCGQLSLTNVSSLKWMY